MKFYSFEQISELDDCLLVFDNSSSFSYFSKLALTGRQKNQCDLSEAQHVSKEQMVQNNWS